VYCFDFFDQNDDAIVYLNKFIDKNPYSEVAWHQLGRQFYALKNYEKAVWAFDYACLIDEGFLGAFLEKAKSLEKLRRYQEAIDCYNITLELDDPTSFAYLRIGKCHEKLGNLEEALSFYLKTVNEDPLLDKGWNALTEYYIRQKNYQKALYYVNKAIGIDADNANYWRKYAHINQYLSFFEEAEVGYRKAFENGSIDLDIFLCWSDILYILGETDAAIELLFQGKDLYADECEILYRLVGLYFNTEKQFEAVSILNEAMLIDQKKSYILKELFPFVWESEVVQRVLKHFNA
jgi:tetratricopeptide (TPR) repeat protein